MENQTNKTPEPFSGAMQIAIHDFQFSKYDLDKIRKDAQIWREAMEKIEATWADKNKIDNPEL